MASGTTILRLMAAGAIALGSCFYAAPAAAGDPGTSSGSFLRFAPGPRGTGMGEAYTAVAEDAYTAWWNPAGMASLERPELSAAYNASLESVSHQYVSLAYPLRYGSTLGVNITRLSVAPFAGYDAKGYKTGNVDSSEMAVAGAYARTLLKDEIERPVFNVGANLKAINSRLESVSASAMALDLGAIYYLRPAKYWTAKNPGREYRFGFSLKNLGTGLKYDKVSFPLPMSATLGAAWISHPRGTHKLTVALDQTFSNDDKYSVGLGAEYFMFQLLSFRGGFKTGQGIGSGVRLGVGFRLSLMDLDYSMSPYGELGAMHKIGFTMRFGAPAAAQPLQGPTARVQAAALMAPKEKIEALEKYASDYVALARKDLAAGLYVPALDNLAKAFNLEPELRGGEWGARYARLDKVAARLRLRETPARAKLLASASEQPSVAREAVDAYGEGIELKAFLLAHAALGVDPRSDPIFEELLYAMAEYNHASVRRDEVLPRTALVKEKLKRAAGYFYRQQFDLAGRECEEVTLLDEKNPLGWTRLGSAYYMMGDKVKSRQAYEKALELNPSDRVVQKFLESMGWK